jgi:hypothetical protein
LIEEAKQKNQKELASDLREVERKIDEYKARVKDIKLTREKKSVRERINDLESKMTQLSNSQIITSLSLSMKDSADTTQLKNKFGQRTQ